MALFFVFLGGLLVFEEIQFLYLGFSFVAMAMFSRGKFRQFVP